MAGKDRARPSALDLISSLRDAPWAYDFFAATRRLQALRPEKSGVGRSQRPSDDAIRFSQVPSSAFAPRTIAELSAPSTPGGGYRVALYANGLFGPNAPLPSVDTERASDRAKQARDRTQAAFADIFHHRFYSLLFRAWADGRADVQRDRGADDRYAAYLAALAGLEAFRTHGSLGDAAPPFAGALAAGKARAETLEGLVQRAAGADTSVREFAGGWSSIPRADSARLRSTRLEGTTPPVLGARVYAPSHAIEVSLGPLDATGYAAVAPRGAKAKKVAEAVRLGAGLQLDWRIRLKRDRASVVGAQLGASDRLGFDAWLGPVKPSGPPLDDLVIAGERYTETEATADRGD